MRKRLEEATSPKSSLRKLDSHLDFENSPDNKNSENLQADAKAANENIDRLLQVSSTVPKKTKMIIPKVYILYHLID